MVDAETVRVSMTDGPRVGGGESVTLTYSDGTTDHGFREGESEGLLMEPSWAPSYPQDHYSLTWYGEGSASPGLHAYIGSADVCGSWSFVAR